jgi:hypothetical protein
MRGQNAEQITYSIVNIEHSMLAITENMLSSQDEVNCLILLLRGPLNHGELFTQANKLNISLKKLDAALASLVGGGLVKFERKAMLIKQTITGKMVINPVDNTMTFVPDNSNNTALITVQKVDFKQFDFSGGNVINYRHVEVAKSQPKPESKTIYHTDIKPINKPDPNTICYYCEKPILDKRDVFMTWIESVYSDRPVHHSCLKNHELTKLNMTLKPSQTIQVSICPLCGKRLGTADTKRCVVASKYSLVHTACFDSLPHVNGLK